MYATAAVGWINDAYVGRAFELRHLRERLQAGLRLLTLRGPAGIGKSRMAWELLDRLGPAGVLACDARDAGDSERLTKRLAQALGIQPSSKEVEEALLQRGRLLLVVDDLEPAPGVAAAIEAWLRGAPELRVVATAREALGLPDEVVVDLEPLAGDEAVELLRLRAAGAGADLSKADPCVLAAIASALDGHPLALELAAAQLSHLPPEQLLERLPARLELLVRDPELPLFSRHTTLREAIESSWRQLSPAERAALAQASVFRGGFDVAAARSIVDLSAFRDAPPAAETMERLRARSLLRSISRGHAAAPRYDMDASVRVFAMRHLDPAERAAVERRHDAWYLDLGDAWAAAVELSADAEAIASLEREKENLLEIHRRALSRTPMPMEAAAAALRATVVLAPLCLIRQNTLRLLQMLDDSLDAASPSRTSTALRSRALFFRGRARLLNGRPASALADLLEVSALARAGGDAVLEGRALTEMARAHREQGRDEESSWCCERAAELLLGAGADAFAANAFHNRAILAAERGELDEAQRWYEQALAAHVRCGNRRLGAVIQGTLGHLLFDRGDHAAAVGHIEAALANFRLLGDARNEAALLAGLGAIHQESGDHVRARVEYERALHLLHNSEQQRLEGQVATNQASTFHEEGRLAEARAGYEGALATLRATGDTRHQAVALLARGILEAEDGTLAEAETMIDRAEQLWRQADDRVHLAAVAAGRGALAWRRACGLRRHGAAEVSVQACEQEAWRHLEHARAANTSEGGRLALRLLERLLRRGTHA